MAIAPLLAWGGFPLWIPATTIATAVIGVWLAIGDLRDEEAQDVRFEVQQIHPASTWEQTTASCTESQELLDETATRPGASPLPSRSAHTHEVDGARPEIDTDPSRPVPTVGDRNGA